MSTDEQAIRDMLANITPGQWSVYRNPKFPELIHGITSTHSHWHISVDEISEADATFIAAAPTIVADLLAEVDRLRGELAAVDGAS